MSAKSRTKPTDDSNLAVEKVANAPSRQHRSEIDKELNSGYTRRYEGLGSLALKSLGKELAKDVAKYIWEHYETN
jgi:hypothetical protein